MLSVSPGVYAFGFLFMLPQLFVNYKVRGVPVCLHGGSWPLTPDPHHLSLFPDEVGGTPALEGLHLQGQCFACRGRSGSAGP